MRAAVLIVSVLLAATVFAKPEVKFSGKSHDIVDVIKEYSQQTGQKFIVDPVIRGKVTILSGQPLSQEEAFDSLSTGLALNSFAMTKRGDTWAVMSARNAQRSLIEVSSDLPKLKPERMAVWVYDFKHISAEDVNRELRILPSKDGELAVTTQTNQMIFTDWTSNLHRIAEILERVDRPQVK